MPKSATLSAPAWSETDIAATPVTAEPRDGRPITIDDLYAFRMVGDPQVSPDRSSILTTLLTIDHDTDEYRAATWRMDADDGNTRQLTSGEWRDGSPRWSPDGRWIAFSSKRGNDDAKTQLWVMPTDGGEPIRVTSFDNGVLEHDWAPDSQRLVVVSLVEMKPEHAETEADVRVITSAHQVQRAWLRRPPLPATLRRRPYRAGRRTAAADRGLVPAPLPGVVSGRARDRVRHQPQPRLGHLPHLGHLDRPGAWR
ncbi:MAG TPA: hypothetical protein VGR22_00935 [Thermomicrobiales bacterium]|nr:hypothetical protein [Thermomicrobiales bacterium]